MLPVNRIENCRRILETGEYQLMNYKIQDLEDVWLIRYLMDLGKTKKEIFDIVNPIHEKKFGYWPDKIFSFKYQQAKKCNINKYSEKINIYNSELYSINHMMVPISQKQFALCVLCLLKASGNVMMDYGELMCSGIKKFVQRPNRREEYDFSVSIEAMVEAGLLDKTEYKNWDEEFGEYDYFEKISISNSITKNKIAFSLDTIIDVQNFYNYIKNMQRCEICGIDFEKSPRCKRTICEECWGVVRRKKESIRVNKFQKLRRKCTNCIVDKEIKESE